LMKVSSHGEDLAKDLPKLVEIGNSGRARTHLTASLMKKTEPECRLLEACLRKFEPR
jgi:hypothetical protein